MREAPRRAARTVWRPEPDADAPRPRLEWVDAGKGVAIALVVLFHATNWLDGQPAGTQAWQDVNAVVSSMRMPLFFVLSGLFAGKWVAASAAALWNVKLRLFAWVFLVWSLIGSVVFVVAIHARGERLGLRSELLALVLTPVLPRFELWFIWALALAFLLARATRRVPVAWQLAVAAAVSAVAFSALMPQLPSKGWSGFLQYYVFFAAGLHLRTHVLRYAARAGWPLHAAAVVVWLGLSLLLWATGTRDVLGLYLLDAVLGVLAGIAVAVAVARVAGLRALGQRTLPVYLTHTPVVMLTASVLGLPVLADVAVVGPFLPPVVAVLAVLASLGMSRLAAGRGPLRFLYEPPPGLAVRPVPVPPAPAASRSGV